jgi:hypothetical protein
MMFFEFRLLVSYNTLQFRLSRPDPAVNASGALQSFSMSMVNLRICVL